MKLPPKLWAPQQKRERAKKSRPEKPSKKGEGSGGGNGQDPKQGAAPARNGSPGPTKFEFIDYHKFAAMDFGSVTWAADGLIPSIGCGFLAAAPKMGKTWLALDLAVAIAAGEPFLGRQTEVGTAAYIGGEGGNYQLQRRLAWIVKGRKLQPSGFAERLVVGLNPRIQLDRVHGVGELKRELDKIQPTLLILDPFTRFHTGKENDRDSMERILGRLRVISEEYQLFCMVVHHAPKPKKDVQYDPLRGSSSMRAWHDALIWLEWEKEDRVIHAEMRDAMEPPRMVLEMDINEDSGYAKMECQTSREDGEEVQEEHGKILEILHETGPITPTELAGRLKRKVATTKRIVASMEEMGLLVQGKEPVKDAKGREYHKPIIRLRD